jgi:hypothetical protein
MMPLTEIDCLKQTVAESWDSRVADQVAAQWRYPSDTAKWWRSSASHVFVLDVDGSRSFLRFVPGAYRGPDHVAKVATMVKAAPGKEADITGLTESMARRWGEALGRSAGVPASRRDRVRHRAE